MNQDLFQSAHQEEWAAFERWLDARARPKAQVRPHDKDVFDDAQFPVAYRRLCQQLALAEKRCYSVPLIRRLQELAQRGHRVLYRPPAPRWHRVLDFFATDFPRLVRAQWRAMSIAALLFFVPLIVAIVVLQYRPELVHSLFGPEQIGKFESMYDPASKTQTLGRESGTDLKMFGYYIMNNVSIGFRTFASGLLAGIGAVFVLVFNGVFIGGIAGHLTAIGYGGPFWRFVVGHSAPELLAIVIAGGAGLHIGMALIAPGRRSRARALVEAGAVGARLALGAVALLIFAAFVEAYWSSLGWMPNPVKFGTGFALWSGILAWLGLGGRDRDSTETRR
jgi:uncharacterized membrane protein SpoIIM required for sporulation